MKRIKIIIQQPKPIESPNIADLKLVSICHPKTSHKLSNTITWGKRTSQVVGAYKILIALLYSDTTKQRM